MIEVILLLTAILCISAGIYFDQILVIFGVFIFYAWTCIYDYDEKSQTQMYMQLLLLLIYFGLLIYLITGLLKSSLSSVKELLGLQPDFLSYLIVIALYLILFFVGKLLSNKISKIILGNND